MSWIASYLDRLHGAVLNAKVNDSNGQLTFEEGMLAALRLFRKACGGDNKIIFVGNGGSAAIASHMATDYTKNGGLRSAALNDGSMLTCLGNDFGYEYVFAKQIEAHARAGDVLVAISSSGESKNILYAVSAAKAAGCSVISLSGFKPGNALRTMGDLNFYIEDEAYGFVEVGHLTILHSILDRSLAEPSAENPS